MKFYYSPQSKGYLLFFTDQYLEKYHERVDFWAKTEVSVDISEFINGDKLINVEVFEMIYGKYALDVVSFLFYNKGYRRYTDFGWKNSISNLNGDGQYNWLKFRGVI